MRGVLNLAYLRRNQALPVLTWAWRFTLGSIMSGIVWELGCAVLFVPGNPLTQLVAASVTAILMRLFLVLLAQGEAHCNAVADATLAQIREGTGFSLAVARSLAELQDGRLNLSSEGATGMTVTVMSPPERVLANSEDPLPTTRPAVSRTGK